jgi:hypothetical protein
MTALFTRDEFASYLHTAVDNSSTDVVERVVWGWLSAATRLTDRPDPAPDDLFVGHRTAARLNNPAAASNESQDDYSVGNDRMRRNEILAAATSRYGTNAGPLYSFPDWDWHWTSVTPSSTTLTQ